MFVQCMHGVKLFEHKSHRKFAPQLERGDWLYRHVLAAASKSSVILL